MRSASELQQIDQLRSLVLLVAVAIVQQLIGSRKNSSSKPIWWCRQTSSKLNILKFASRSAEEKNAAQADTQSKADSGSQIAVQVKGDEDRCPINIRGKVSRPNLCKCAELICPTE